MLSVPWFNDSDCQRQYTGAATGAHCRVAVSKEVSGLGLDISAQPPLPTLGSRNTAAHRVTTHAAKDGMVSG